MTAITSPTAFSRLWLRWKALRLPWRKQFLCGSDLAGNTFWEFRLSGQESERLRRIVKYPREAQMSDVEVAPQWIQWLRHTRRDPPSIQEQQMDVVRQERMKVLAAEADAKWAAKDSYLEMPAQAPTPSAKSDLDRMAQQFLPPQSTEETRHSPGAQVKQTESTREARSEQASPWAASTKTKDEPESWSPKTIRR
ncbi:hypothetical protein BT63DRAFT_21488 [Microthyrium microscopicum]|uniref:Uncharacterized protein n=1 Tax=Microthyrium microscopicum TaxID=703497 RepID=A0A6A6UTL8_9PEZI|nr:hypothetical protein BT63DRAFT_21488 [Microthyrium microscopicum]